MRGERPWKLSLNTVPRKYRVKWMRCARVHCSWTQNWNQVIFSDKSFFVIGRKSKVYCTVGLVLMRDFAQISSHR